MNRPAAELTIAQYTTGTVCERIETALGAAGKALIDLAQIDASGRVLDAGTGIGGTARLIAAEHGCRVTAVDLTPEYCDVAKWLNDPVGLGDLIEVRAADVTDLPFDAASFDVVVSQHVQMNIADKRRLYAEARRVLAPGGRLALWDVTAGPGGTVRLPVPWAGSSEQSHLVTAERLTELLLDAGFAIDHWNDLTESVGNAMREFFAGEPPPLGLHVLVPDFQAKATNLVRNVAEGRVRLIQAVLSVAAPLVSEQRSV